MWTLQYSLIVCARTWYPLPAILQSLGDDHTGFTSSITVAELSVGAHLAQRKDALEKTLHLLEIVEIIDLDTRIAIEAAEIYASLVKKGKTVELTDCL